MTNTAFKDSLGSELDHIKPNVGLVKKHVKNSNAQLPSLMVMYMRRLMKNAFNKALRGLNMI